MFPARGRMLWYRHVIVSLAVLAILIFTYPQPACAQAGPISRLPTDEKVVALTFDDIPLPGTTEKLVNILKEESVTATFFLEGKGIAAYPAQARYIRDNGFAIGNHTYSHPVLPRLTDARIIEEASATRKCAIDILGVDTAPFFRLPYGSYNSRVISALNGAGYTDIIGWTIDTNDWKGSIPAGSIIQVVESGLRPGSIILMHVSCDNTVQALPTIIRFIKSQGYGFTDIPTFYGMPQPQQRSHEQTGTGETDQNAKQANPLSTEDTATSPADKGYSPTEVVVQEEVIEQNIRPKVPYIKTTLPINPLSP